MNIQEFGIFITDRNVVKLRSTTIRHHSKFKTICNHKLTEIFKYYFSQFKENSKHLIYFHQEIDQIRKIRKDRNVGKLKVHDHPLPVQARRHRQHQNHQMIQALQHRQHQNHQIVQAQYQRQQQQYRLVKAERTNNYYFNTFVCFSL